MNFLLWLLGLFVLAVVLIIAAHNSAYLLLVYPPYRIEMSFNLFILLLLTLFGLGYWVVHLILCVIRLGRNQGKQVNKAHRQGD